MSSLRARSGRSSIRDTAGPNGARDPDAGPELQLDLRVGALVVYGGYGLGRVARKRQSGRGTHAAGSVVLEFADGLTVTLPLGRAVICLRPVAGADDIVRVRDALQHPRAAHETSWQARTKLTRTKIAAGETVGLAEVVRDGATREQGSNGGALSMYERELYLKARRLLVAELGAATATDEAQADAWIDGQLGASAVGCGDHVPR